MADSRDKIGEYVEANKKTSTKIKEKLKNSEALTTPEYEFMYNHARMFGDIRFKKVK